MVVPPYTEDPTAGSFVVFPTHAHQILSNCIHILGVSVLSYCFARRTEHDQLNTRQGWVNMTWAKLCVMLVFADSWFFLAFSGILVNGVGLSYSLGTCSLGIYACIFFYAGSKLLIYTFLTERVWIVWSAGNTITRRESTVYRVCAVVVMGYFCVFVLMFVGRLISIRKDGACTIGVRMYASISLLTYDLFVNVFLTSMFVFPFYREDLKKNTKLRTLARRTLVAAIVALTTSSTNVLILTLLGGKQLGWVCLGSCGADVTVNAIVLFWVTAGGHRDGTRCACGCHPSSQPGAPLPLSFVQDPRKSSSSGRAVHMRSRSGGAVTELDTMLLDEQDLVYSSPVGGFEDGERGQTKSGYGGERQQPRQPHSSPYGRSINPPLGCMNRDAVILPSPITDDGAPHNQNGATTTLTSYHSSAELRSGSKRGGYEDRRRGSVTQCHQYPGNGFAHGYANGHERGQPPHPCHLHAQLQNVRSERKRWNRVIRAMQSLFHHVMYGKEEQNVLPFSQTNSVQVTVTRTHRMSTHVSSQERYTDMPHAAGRRRPRTADRERDRERGDRPFSGYEGRRGSAAGLSSFNEVRRGSNAGLGLNEGRRGSGAGLGGIVFNHDELDQDESLSFGGEDEDLIDRVIARDLKKVHKVGGSGCSIVSIQEPQPSFSPISPLSPPPPPASSPTYFGQSPLAMERRGSIAMTMPTTPPPSATALWPPTPLQPTQGWREQESEQTCMSSLEEDRT